MGKIVRLARPQACLGNRINIFGRSTEHAHLLPRHQIKHDIAIRKERRTIVQHYGGTTCQPRDQPVPHHPATGREIEQSIVRTQVDMQLLLHEMFEEGSSRSVHNTFRHACRARRVHDVKRMIKRQTLKINLRCIRFKIGNQPGIGIRRQVRLVRNQRHDHGALKRRQTICDCAKFFKRIVSLAVVPVAISAEEHFGRDLAKAVQYALDAEVRRTGRPHGPYGCARQHCCNGLRHVRHEATNPIAGDHPRLFETVGKAGDLGIEFGKTEGTCDLILSLENQGQSRILPTQKILRKIQSGVGKPAGAGHLLPVNDDGIRISCSNHPRPIPDVEPELFGRLNRPTMQLGVVLKIPIPAQRGLTRKTGHVSDCNLLGSRLPQGVLAHDVPLVKLPLIQPLRVYRGAEENLTRQRCP